jgi:hypothetical protein
MGTIADYRAVLLPFFTALTAQTHSYRNLTQDNGVNNTADRAT